ncbi:uncharacterized protein METZ01_LOCUS326509 [marine metagenome]|uniref:BPL/LPL catalytic domain-containing protein n=1 Tax=marine metagenome TaxID=408172 RepID=A0A382PLX0_9ZZZZ
MGTTDLSARVIKKGLGTTVMGCRVRSYTLVTSTMNVARWMANTGCPEGTIVVADMQTAARGRFNRPWASLPGVNLTFSVVLCPSPELLRDVNMAATVALVRCIRDVSGLRATVKWPNDVRIGGKKACGVLVEGTLTDSAGYVILGVGMNVNYNPTPVLEPRVEATSIALELGHEVSRLEVMRSFLRIFDRLYRTLNTDDSLYQEWRSYLDTLGQLVHVRLGEQVEEGFAAGVDRDGDLVLRRADGSTVSLSAGEVTTQL